MKYKLTLFLFLVFAVESSFAQDIDIPTDYTLDAAEDYAPYEDKLVECVDWLLRTPAIVQPSKRGKAYQFIFEWVTGSPTVTVMLDAKIVDFGNQEMLFLFMGAWAKYSITTHDYKDKTKGTLAALDSVFDLYTNNQSFFGKDKHIEKMMKMKVKGKLKAYVDKIYSEYD